MKIKELYERPLKYAIDEMNLIDVKIDSDAEGEVQAVLLKYTAPCASQMSKEVSDEERIWS